MYRQFISHNANLYEWNFFLIVSKYVIVLDQYKYVYFYHIRLYCIPMWEIKQLYNVNQFIAGIYRLGLTFV